MAMNILKSEDRGLIENKIFKGHALFSNGIGSASRLDAFGAVYVFNDDVLYPQSYLGTHPHENVEIVTIMVSGTESHKDTLGIHENYHAGDVQLISSGQGLRHEGGNVSTSEPARHLQIWIKPKYLNLAPKVLVKKAKPSKNGMLLLVSPDAELGSLKINQDVWIFESSLELDKKINYKVQKPGNGIIIYVMNGEIKINSKILKQENTAFIWNQENIEVTSKSITSNFVLIDTTR
jgi:redox-sensitive bicupin YhaK (pirin superfamily)